MRQNVPLSSTFTSSGRTRIGTGARLRIWWGNPLGVRVPPPARGVGKLVGVCQVAEVEDAAVGEVPVEDGPDAAGDVFGGGELAGGVEVDELLTVGEVVLGRSAELRLHSGVDGAGCDGQHLHATALGMPEILLRPHVAHPLVDGALSRAVRRPAGIDAPGGAGGQHDEVAGSRDTGGGGEEQVAEDLRRGAV